MKKFLLKQIFIFLLALNLGAYSAHADEPSYENKTDPKKSTLKIEKTENGKTKVTHQGRSSKGSKENKTGDDLISSKTCNKKIKVEYNDKRGTGQELKDAQDSDEVNDAFEKCCKIYPGTGNQAVKDFNFCFSDELMKMLIAKTPNQINLPLDKGNNIQRHQPGNTNSLSNSQQLD